MLAPLRFPPCFTVWVEASKIFMNDTGPDATPIVDFTKSPFGRRRENAKPVPPPPWWIRACCLSASKIPTRLSSTGITKHAESNCNSRPAFMSVGLFGRNSRFEMMRKNRRAVSATCASSAP